MPQTRSASIKLLSPRPSSQQRRTPTRVPLNLRPASSPRPLANALSIDNRRLWAAIADAARPGIVPDVNQQQHNTADMPGSFRLRSDIHREARGIAIFLPLNRAPLLFMNRANYGIVCDNALPAGRASG